MELSIRIIESGCFLMSGENKYCNMSRGQMMQMFLPSIKKYKIVEPHQKADICIFSIQLQDASQLRDDEVNILICIENCPRWPWYPHFNKYKDYGNPKIDIYLYNHISKIYIPENSKFLAVPTLYPRLDYFSFLENYYKNQESLNCSFKDKKFCLMINKSSLNQDINNFVEILSEIGQVDNISLYDSKIKNVSCYNAIELLEVFNKYKFIITFENSYNDGYITEKIFNVFFSKSIPLYAGSGIADKIFNPKSFIHINPKEISKYAFDRIQFLNISEDQYNSMINEKKINNSFNNENYMEKIDNFIKNKLDSKI